MIEGALARISLILKGRELTGTGPAITVWGLTAGIFGDATDRPAAPAPISHWRTSADEQQRAVSER
jgi:hypothetical protein